jgi:hypothetical protein
MVAACMDYIKANPAFCGDLVKRWHQSQDCSSKMEVVCHLCQIEPNKYGAMDDDDIMDMMTENGEEEQQDFH